MNVDMCTSIKSVNYVYTYTYKGPDRANMEIVNEVAELLDARYVTTPEACCTWKATAYQLQLTRVPQLRDHVPVVCDLVLDYARVRFARPRAWDYNKLAFPVAFLSEIQRFTQNFDTWVSDNDVEDKLVRLGDQLDL